MSSRSLSKFLTCFANPRQSAANTRSHRLCSPANNLPFVSLPPCCCSFVLVLSRPQGEGMVVATVHGTELRNAEVDADATARIFALQQQIYTLRKSTLENLISRGYLGLLATQTSQASPSRLSSAL